MSNIAVHMRMTGMQVSNDDVDSRKAAAAELAAAWGKLKDMSLIAVKANEIALAVSGDGTPPHSLGVEVEALVQAHASAFLYVDRPLDVGICAAAAAVDLMASEPSASVTTADIFATALWLALGFQPSLGDAKREALRNELLDAARSRSIKAAEISRQRTVVNDFGELFVTTDAESNITANLKKATAATIEALRRNAALDREELDFLWAFQRSRSTLLARSHRDIEEPLRLVATGIEAASHLRRLPCDVHRDVVLRTLERDPELDLADLLAVIGADREKLGSPFENGLAARASSVFPLLHSLATGTMMPNGSNVKRSSAEWGQRALLEAGLVRLITGGPGKL